MKKFSLGRKHIHIHGLTFDKEIVGISKVNKSLTLKEKVDVQQHKSEMTNIPNAFRMKIWYQLHLYSCSKPCDGPMTKKKNINSILFLNLYVCLYILCYRLIVIANEREVQHIKYHNKMYHIR